MRGIIMRNSFLFGIVMYFISVTVAFSSNKVTVVVTTNPPELRVVVDGVTVRAPDTVSWTPLSQHTIGVIDTVPNGTGSRLVWSSWSNAGAKTQVVAPGVNTTYTANFTTQYYLTMVANSGGSVTPSSGYFNSGQQVQITGIPSSGQLFQSWTGSGIGSVSGSSDPASVTIGGPITETANFMSGSPQITIQALPPGLLFLYDEIAYSSPQTRTVNSGEYHSLSDYSPQAAGDGVEYVFQSWSDGGANAHAIYPFTSGTYTLTYKKQYRFLIWANGGGTVNPGPAYFDSGTVVSISATALPGSIFNGWTGIGIGSYTGSNPTATIIMGGPVTETAWFSPPKVHVTMTTNPDGMRYTADNVLYSTSQAFIWDSGSTHTLCGVQTSLSPDGPAWFPAGWVDGYPSSCRTIVPLHDTAFTATYNPYYYLTLSDSPECPSSGGPLPGSGYQPEGSCFQLDTSQVVCNSVQSRFVGWIGTGSGSYTGTDPFPQICMDGNITETAVLNVCHPALSPTDTLFSPMGGKGTLTLTNDNWCNWSVAQPAVSWVHFDSAYTAGEGNAVFSYTVDENPDSTARSTTLTFWSGLPSLSSVQIDQRGRISCPPPWNYINTGMNHTIILDTNLHPTVLGAPLETGDFIGVFYDSGGTPACGGYEMWDAGAPLAIAAFGNELSLPGKDGFATGEVFQWQIFRCQENKFYDAVATYDQPDPANHLTNTNSFATNGISRLHSLTTTMQTESLAVRRGWGMISSSINPDSWNLDSLFAPVMTDVIILKSGDGKTYIPSLPVNSIGLWNPGAGYQLKMDTARQLPISGREISPERAPVTLSTGWSLIPYLRQSAMGIDTALSTIAGSLLIAKDQDGNAYIPSIPVNGIGQMEPGQGYQVKLSAADTLIYPMNSFLFPKRIVDAHRAIAKFGKPHYQVNTKTDNNATIVVPKKVIEGILMKGDEVGVFDQKGVLVGSGRYEGENFGVAVWGDDPTTPAKDGLISGEKYELRFWYSTSKAEHRTRKIEWKEGAGAYEVNGIAIVAKVEVDLADMPIPDHVQLYQNYPNPFNPSTTIRFSIPKAMDVRIRMYNVLGEAIAEVVSGRFETGYHEIGFTSTALPSGVYYCRIEAGGASDVKKMIFMK